MDGSELKDPADLLPFAKDIIIAPGEVIPKDPLLNELPLIGKLISKRKRQKDSLVLS